MVLHRIHSPTKKEKRSKKERTATTTTESKLSINFGLVNTYKAGRGGQFVPDLLLVRPWAWALQALQAEAFQLLHGLGSQLCSCEVKRLQAF